jgi:predicted TIM-barrel fold metal-dependent hydrolase
MRVVALEEHYATQKFLEGPGRRFMDRFRSGPPHPRFGDEGGRNLFDRLLDVSEWRIAEMDKARVDVQVLSLTSPGLEQSSAADAVAMARETNDFLGDAIRRNPTRLAGFAALPTADPAAAADELERALGLQGFVGAVINGHCQGRHLDDEFFWPIFERLEGLDVPLYLHPTLPPQPVVDLVYAGNYSEFVTQMFAMAAWGWHIETATHVLRLILSGVFDRFPRLQLIIGHMGEVLPFMLPRLDMTLPTAITSLHRAPSDYLRQNVHYTFSGFNWTSVFLELLFQIGVDRIMFSTDYPYASMTQATSFLDSIPVSPADRERIAHRNAEQLLRL